MRLFYYNRIIIITTIVFGSLIASCGGGDDYNDNPVITPESKLEVDGQDFVLAGEGDSRKIEIRSNTGWSVKTDVSWLKITPEAGVNYGTVTIVAAANDLLTERNADIIIEAAGTKKAIVHVTQKVAGDHTLTVKASELEFVCRDFIQPLAKVVSIDSGAEWTAFADAEWCKCVHNTDRELAVSVEDNYSTQDRSCKVTVKTAYTSSQIVVYQKGAGEMQLDQTTISFGSTKTSKTLKITSEAPWEAVSNEEWCSLDVTSTKNISSKVVSVKITVDNYYKLIQRSAIITFKTADQTKSVEIKQDGTTPLVVPENIAFGEAKSSQTVTITSGATWNAEPSKEWCTCMKTTDKTLKIQVDENLTTSNRECTILVTTENETKNIQVSQTKGILPVVSSFIVSSVGYSSVKYSISYSSALSIKSRGVCFSETNTTPTISDGFSKSANSWAGGEPGKTYYLRGYVTNGLGTSYSDNVITITIPTGVPSPDDNITP